MLASGLGPDSCRANRTLSMLWGETLETLFPKSGFLAAAVAHAEGYDFTRGLCLLRMATRRLKLGREDVDILPDRLAWYIAGPAIGLCVVALYALINQRMGVTTSYQMIVQMATRYPVREMWRVWFFFGLVGGSLVAVVLQGGPHFSTGYGALGALLPVAVLIPVLFIGGVLSGFGARWSGGCTSGHGISGTSSLSPASIAATMTFVGTAVVVTLVLHLLTGGDL